jgi:CRISPR-associated protein Cmr2
MNNFQKRITVAIAWCLAWGDGKQPKHSVEALCELRQAILTNRPLDDSPLQEILQQTQTLVSFSNDGFEFPSDREALANLCKQHSGLSEAKIGLVYGGATKIKGYVFESADLQEIRGASALLDRINLIDLPAFFEGETARERFQQCHDAAAYCRQVRSDWLHSNFPSLEDALTPEMVIYSTGGNILAFCPAALVDDLADAIEKRYTTETLTANACAVGDTFRPLEIYLGLLATPMEKTPWLETIEGNNNNPALRAYFGLATKQQEDGTETEVLTPAEAFRQTKGFSELVGKLANQFNQRRSGYDVPGSSRPSRRYPPMFETHPYLMRDDSDRRSAVVQVPVGQLTKNPKFSESIARKYLVGQISKREYSSSRWYFRRSSPFRQQVQGRNRLWKPGPLISWVSKFEQFVDENGLVSLYDAQYHIFFPQRTRQRLVRDMYKREARTLAEIGAADPNGFVAYIYADGNNMGQYIRDSIKTPEHYQRFSQDVFEATENSVYWALAHHVRPYEYIPDAKSPRSNRNPVWIHPFEIITIGGDDVLLIVPANKALEVASSIGQEFEQRLSEDSKPYVVSNIHIPEQIHRNPQQTPFCPIKQNKLSISSGVLITSADTPIYYARNLVSQLLKSAKRKAKELSRKQDDNHYLGGTVDFLTLKAVTMISSDIESFRQEGLTVRFPERKQDLKLYAAPFTLHELEGLIKTIQAVKSSGFPKSQLYQVRSLLERGKRTAILNYRYFKVRLQKERDRTLLKEQFEDIWCRAITNPGSLAPWIPDLETTCRNLMILLLVEAIPDENFIWKYRFLQTLKKYTYRTIWREIVDLYPFIEVLSENDDNSISEVMESTTSEEVQA